MAGGIEVGMDLQPARNASMKSAAMAGENFGKLRRAFFIESFENIGEAFEPKSEMAFDCVREFHETLPPRKLNFNLSLNQDKLLPMPRERPATNFPLIGIDAPKLLQKIQLEERRFAIRQQFVPKRVGD